jgi:urease subunit alpha
VSQAAYDAGIADALKLQKPVVAVRGMRALRKGDMVHNGATPVMEVDPETYEVRADGRLLTCQPAVVLPLAQRYFLF